MKLGNIGRRFRQVREYAAMGTSPSDRGALAVLGVARGHPFSSTGIIGSMGHRLFPELIVRPERLGGLKLSIDPADVTHMVIFDEIVRDNNYDLDLVPFRPDLILDCGGHIGMFSLLASARYPGVPIAVFEPNPRNVARIRRQLAVNDDALAVEVVPAAVSVRNGEATFEDRVSFSGHLTSGSTPAADDAKGRYTVRVIDLPELIRRRPAERLLIKLDIEGEETAVIPRLFDVMPQATAIFLETHDGDEGWERAAGQFREHGFAVERRRAWENCIDGFAVRTARRGQT